MKMIENIAVTDQVFGSSNAVESAPEWDNGTSYSEGQIVQVAAAKRIYESLVDANSGNDPVTDTGDNWLDVGPTNPWAMFDEYSETQTIRAGNITVTLNPGSLVTSIALSNMAGTQVQIIQNDPIEGITYDETFSLNSYDNIADYWDYFFAPIVRKTDLFIDDIPPYANATITLVLDNPEGDAAIGKMVIGTVQELGATLYGAEFGRLDSSRITEDGFGNLTIVRRSSRRRMSLNVIVARENVDEVGRILDDRRGLPTVFVGQEDYTQTLVDGIPREWRVVIEHLKSSRLSIDIEGLR